MTDDSVFFLNFNIESFFLYLIEGFFIYLRSLGLKIVCWLNFSWLFDEKDDLWTSLSMLFFEYLKESLLWFGSFEKDYFWSATNFCCRIGLTIVKKRCRTLSFIWTNNDAFWRTSTSLLNLIFVSLILSFSIFRATFCSSA